MKSKWAGVNAARARSGRGAATLTKPEREWMEQLRQRQLAGELRGWWEHPCSLRLGQKVHYEPDFMAVGEDGVIEMHELKGPRGFRLDGQGRAKLYAAASMYPLFRFLLIQQQLKRDGGGFKVEEVPPRLGLGDEE